MTFRQLLSPSGQEVLDEITERTGQETDLALGTRLRRTHPPELVAAAMSQHSLRLRALTKFGDDAARLYFTPEALEQSTRSSVATHRARRIAASGVRGVLDLGCGIGGDLIAFARAGLHVRGVERDPLRAAIARANLAALGFDGEVLESDAASVHPNHDEVVFLDPARRAKGGRVFDPAAMSPSWEFVTAALARRSVVKTLPGIAHSLIPEGIEAEWVSDHGNLVEACLWSREFSQVPRRASLLPHNDDLRGHGLPGRLGEPGGWLHEPDDAVIRSGLVGELGTLIDGSLIDSKIAYLTTDTPVSTPFARSFRILSELPFREKALKAALVQRDIGTLTIKKRGVELTPEALVRKLKLKGTRAATVVLTRVANEGRAFLVEPQGSR